MAIIGRNFKGKTTIPTAIRLAIMGSLPEVGMRPRDTMNLAAGDTMMAAEVMWDDGTSIGREWRLDVDGETVKLRTVGKEIGNVALLDPSAFFEMTERDRIDYIFKTVTLPDSFRLESILAEAERITFGEDHSENHEKAKSEQLALVRNTKVEGNRLQDWLGENLKRLGEAYTYFNRRQRETQGAVATLTDLKLQEKDLPAEKVPAIEAAITELQGKIDILNQRIGTAQSEQGQQSYVVGRRAIVREALDADRTDWALMIKQAEEAMAERKKKVKPYSNARYLKAVAERAEHLKIRPKVLADFNAASKSYDAALAGLVELKTAKQCPHCKSTGEGWKKNLKKELETQRDTSKAELGEAGDHLAQIDDAVKTLDKEIATLTATGRANDQLNAEIRTLEVQLEKHQQGQDKDENRFKELQTELEGLKDVPAPSDADIKALVDERDGIIEQRKAQEGIKSAATRLQQDVRRAAQSELEHRSMKASLDVVKALQLLLNEKRSTMMGQVFDSLLEIANRIVGKILPTPLAFKDGFVGRWCDAGFIRAKVGVFSGTEMELAYIGIATALSSQSHAKIAILDEWDRLDEGNKKLVVAALHDAMAANLIEQFIVVGTESLPQFPPEYLLEVIKVG